MSGSPTVRSPTLLAAGLLGLVIGSECFFRFAELPPAKLLSTGLIGLGVLAVGMARWSWTLLPLRAAAAVVFGAYLAQACWRFPGLMKDPQPYAATGVLWLVLRVEALLALPMVAIGGIAGYWAKRRASARGDLATPAV